jgi:hypothetical protein
MSGKGSTPRPYSVDAQTFADNWTRIFGAKQEGSPNKLEVSCCVSRESDEQGEGQAEGRPE